MNLERRPDYTPNPRRKTLRYWRLFGPVIARELGRIAVRGGWRSPLVVMTVAVGMALVMLDAADMVHVGGEASLPSIAATPTIGSKIGTVSDPPACTHYAERGTNNDTTVTGTGTQANPWVGRDAPQTMASNLTAGQVGCIGGGTYDLKGPGSGLGANITGGTDAAEHEITFTNSGTSTSRITLQSKPGEVARLISGMYIAPTKNYITVRDLYIDGTGSVTTNNATNQNRYATHAAPRIFGNNVSIINNEITKRARDRTLAAVANKVDFGVCVHTGGGANPITGLTFEGNWVHDCGAFSDLYDAAVDTAWTGKDDNHCVYANDADGALFSKNLFHDCAESGIQFFPNTNDAIWEHGIIARADVNMVIRYDQAAVANNIIRNSILAYPRGTGTTYNNPTGTGNQLTDVCVYTYGGTSGLGTVSGTTQTGVLTRSPLFAHLPTNNTAGNDDANDDYTIGDSQCQTKLGVSQGTPPPASSRFLRSWFDIFPMLVAWDRWR